MDCEISVVVDTDEHSMFSRLESVYKEIIIAKEARAFFQKTVDEFFNEVINSINKK